MYHFNTHSNNPLIQHDIEILLQCANRCCEIDSSDPMGERVVEEFVSLALSSLFDKVIIRNVSVDFPPDSTARDALISIAIRAQGCDPAPIVDQTNLDCVVESCLSSALLELFGSLAVERCIVA